MPTSRARTALLINHLSSLLPVREISAPVFILGCGRSGTTILGTALSRHSKITYLNERRDLWLAAYSQTDVWSDDAPKRGGKLVLTQADADPRKSRRLRRLFFSETRRTRKPVLVEKLPVNSFRVGLIRSIFPDARFVHIFRNGLEVARSIERVAVEGAWFGSNGYKWRQLVTLATTHNNTAALPHLCTDYCDKGLLEWRLSTEAVVGCLRHLRDDEFLEVSYQTLTSEPARTIARVLSFVGVEREPAVINWAHDHIARRTESLTEAVASQQQRRIGGELLLRSMDAVNDRLTTVRVDD